MRSRRERALIVQPMHVNNIYNKTASSQSGLELGFLKDMCF